jgi:hypothetical protein
MTNLEAYKDDLMKIEGDFAFDKTQQKIAGCNCTNDEIECIECENCLFNDAPYCIESTKINWLCKEYEPPVLADSELELIEAVGKATNKKYKYLAKQKGGRTTLFTNKPFINKSNYGYYYYTTNNDFADISNKGFTLFKNIENESGIYDIENKCFIKTLY